MPIGVVIRNSEDLSNAVCKAILFSSVTLFLILCALISAVYVATQNGLEEFGDAAPFLLLTSPFILHALQLLATILILLSAAQEGQVLTMTKCRLWSLLSRILTAPILIEMMILIGFKWYLTFVAIPLVTMYFLTVLHVEQIIHYFFTTQLLHSRHPPPHSSPLGGRDGEWSSVLPHPFSAPPPTYLEACLPPTTPPSTPDLLPESPPPPYQEAIKTMEVKLSEHVVVII